MNAPRENDTIIETTIEILGRKKVTPQQSAKPGRPRNESSIKYRTIDECLEEKIEKIEKIEEEYKENNLFSLCVIIILSNRINNYNYIVYI